MLFCISSQIYAEEVTESKSKPDDDSQALYQKYSDHLKSTNYKPDKLKELSEQLQQEVAIKNIGDSFHEKDLIYNLGLSYNHELYTNDDPYKRDFPSNKNLGFDFGILFKTNNLHRFHGADLQANLGSTTFSARAYYQYRDIKKLDSYSSPFQTGYAGIAYYEVDNKSAYNGLSLAYGYGYMSKLHLAFLSFETRATIDFMDKSPDTFIANLVFLISLVF